MLRRVIVGGASSAGRGVRSFSSQPPHRPPTTKPQVVTKPTPQQVESRIARETRERNNALDLMNDIMHAEDRRHGGNNAFTPPVRQDVLLSRRDNHPFDAVQPKFGTKKSAIDETGTLQPVAPQGKTTGAQHVNGRQDYKSDSAYTSFSGLPVGIDGKAPKQLVDNPLYGKNLIVTNPAEDPTGGEVLDQFDLQRQIRTATDPGLDDTAVLRSAPHPQPSWQPTPEERAIMPSVGVDPHQPTFSFRERDLVNTARDKEYLVKGPVKQFDFQAPDVNGTSRSLGKDELRDLARKAREAAEAAARAGKQ